MIIKKGECFLGRTLELCTKDIEIAVTLDVGPRIISLKKKNNDNIFFNDLNNEINKDCSAIYGDKAIWHIYGGHRIWLSPEDDSTYYPDNSPVDYEVMGGGVLFTAPVMRGKGVRLSLYIEFISDNELLVTMKAKNESVQSKKFAIWGLTVCKAGGKLDIPLSSEDTGFLQNRNIVLWSYTDIKDNRLNIENDKISITSSALSFAPLKIGCYNKQVFCKYQYRDTTFIKELIAEKGDYPDWNCNIECYINNLIHEIETLSPLQQVETGEEIFHSEKWKIL